MGRQDFETETLIPTGGCFDVAHSLRGEGFDASEDGTGRGTPLVPVSFPWQMGGTMQMPHDLDLCGTLVKNQSQAVAFAQNQRDELRTMTVAGALAAEPGMKQQTYVAHPPPVFVDIYNHAVTGDVAATMSTTGGGLQSGPSLMQSMQVRRLTPRECERLQGFPDDYTDIKPSSKPTPDGPRYKALGNSMAVPVMAWIGKRIADLDAIGAAETQRPTAGF
jgi:DNA (cytosine-5)-methyltransferase 1